MQSLTVLQNGSDHTFLDYWFHSLHQGLYCQAQQLVNYLDLPERTSQTTEIQMF